MDGIQSFWFGRGQGLSLAVLLVCAQFVCVAIPGRAEVLATKALSDVLPELFDVDADALEASVSIGFASSDVIVPGDPLLFEDLVFRLDDVGQTFTVTTAEDSDFVQIVGLLTDGIDSLNFFEQVEMRRQSSTPGNVGVVSSESAFFDTLAGPGPDLEGFIITDIAITIDSLLIDTAGSINFGTFTRFGKFDATLIVNGSAIPEPTSLASLAAIGLLFNIALRRVPYFDPQVYSLVR